MTIHTPVHPRGFITVVVVILLVIMTVFAAVATSSAIRLRREVKLIEKQQVRRLAPPGKPAQ